MLPTSILRITKHVDVVKKVRLLLWKNFWIQTRHKLDTIVEIIWPLCFFLILIFIQSENGIILQPAKDFPVSIFHNDIEWNELM